MIKRFVEFKSQIDEITHKAEKIITSNKYYLVIGITSNKVKSIKMLEIKYDEWEIILKPFYESTVILSSSDYPTLSTAYFFRYYLISFLNKSDIDNNSPKH
jgi:hypothetical protein